MGPTVYLSRMASFSAAHRLNAPGLSAEENLQTYGKCNGVNGHGHNYKVELTVKGPVNETTGMVINISHLKECIQVAIMDPLDHQNLDRDVPFFHQRPSTTENLVLFIWQNVQAFLGPGWLYRIKLYETDLNFVEYFGDEV